MFLHGLCSYYDHCKNSNHTFSLRYAPLKLYYTPFKLRDKRYYIKKLRQIAKLKTE